MLKCARWLHRLAPVPSWLVLLPLCLALAWDWAQAVQAGFWIDETGGYWLSRHLPNLTQTTFELKDLGFAYAALLRLFNWGEPPWFELIARLPSLFAALGCAALLYSLSERVNGQYTGWVAAVIYAVLPTTLDFSTEARPYAFGQLVFAATLWMLERWFAGRHWALIPHLFGMVLLVYIHPFFALIWPLAWLFVVRADPARRLRYTLGLALAALLLAPLAYMATHLETSIGAITYAPRVGLRQFLLNLMEQRVGWALVAGLVGAAVLGVRMKRPRPLLAAWAALWLAWPLSLFALARITGSSYYVERYLALSAVGFALLAAGVLGLWRPWVRQAVLLLVVASHFAPNNLWRHPRAGDLRELAAWIENPQGGGTAPWIANSLFVEGRLPPNSTPEATLASWGWSHVSTYPVLNPTFPMPYQLAESGRAALEAQLDGPWQAEKRIIAGPIQVTPPSWFVEAMRRRGYRMQQFGEMLDFRR